MGGLGLPRLRYIAVGLLYALLAALVFYPTADNLFRSDYWLLSVLLHGMGWNWEDLRRVMAFEMFGDIRAQPLAWLASFARHSLLGTNFVAHHWLNMGLHIANGYLIFLILSQLTRAFLLSSLLGLLFLVLVSHFDTVAWTHHLYIVLGTTGFLTALLLTLSYIRRGRGGYLWAALPLAVVSGLLYEPFLPAPAALLIIAWTGRGKSEGRGLGPFAGLAIASYLFLFLVDFTFYLLSRGASRYSLLGDVLAPLNMGKAFLALLLNLGETTFLKNVGLMPRVEITDLVYLHLPQGLFSLGGLFKLSLGLGLVALFRIRREDRWLLLVLFLFFASFLLLMFLNRMVTNSISYGVSQPRYQYFPNALAIIAAGLLLRRHYKRKLLSYFLGAVIAALVLFNAQNTLSANRLVDGAMAPLGQQHKEIGSFLATHPSATVFPDFIPDNQRRLSSWGDISIDVLYYGKGVTRWWRNATHIYDGTSFRPNPNYNPQPTSTYLGDFTVEFLYTGWSRRGFQVAKETEVLRFPASYPRVAITPTNRVKVELLNAGTGQVESFEAPLPRRDLLYHMRYASLTPWVWIAIEKDGTILSFIINGEVSRKVVLHSPYLGWRGEGLELLGDYYRGAGEMVHLARLFVQLDRPRYASSQRPLGDRIKVELVRPW